MKKKENQNISEEKSLEVIEKKKKAKKLTQIIKKRVLRNTTQTIILMLALVGLFIGLNLWVNTLDLPSIDITKEKLYTLSEDSKNQIAKVENDVNIYLFGYDETSTLLDLAKQYTRANEKVKVELIDLSTRIDLAEKYEVTSSDIGIVVESGQRSKILSSYDMYTYDTTTYETIDISEEKLTNAIIEVTIAKKPKIYFLTGHGEYSLTTEIATLKLYLENEVNEIETLELLVKETVPEDADLLVIPSPTKDITEYEAEIIIGYINRGGKILFLQDPELNGTTYSNLQKVLDLFGVKISNGVVMEQDENHILLQSPNFVLPEAQYHTITNEIIKDGGIVVVNSAKLTFVDSQEYETLGISVNNILQTTDKAYLRTNLNIQSTNKNKSDEEGTFIIGSEIQKTINENTKATLIIYSNCAFISDARITVGQQSTSMIYLKNNKDFILNTVAYLTEREDAIKIRKDTGVVNYTPTEQENNIVKVIIFAIPCIIILVGIIVWQVRRRKK